MNVFEIISAVLLILTSILIIVLVMMQDSTDGMSSAVTGETQSYFGSNRGRTREEKLKKITKICVIVFMVLTLAVGIVGRFVK